MTSRVRIGFSLASVLMASIVLCSYQPVDAAKPAKSASRPLVRLGLVKTLFRDLPEPLLHVAMRPFKALMEAQTGCNSQIVNGGDADSLATKLKEKDVHLGVFHGVEFAWARLKFPELQPLLIAVNEQPYLRAHLVVANDPKIKGVADLKGETIALPAMSKEHCHLFLERRCTVPGVAPKDFYAQIVTPGDSEDALDQLAEGKFKAAVLDEVAFNTYRKLKPIKAEGLRSLQASESMPCAVIAYWPGTFSDEMVERFREGMIKAKSTAKGRQMLSMVRITGFENLPDDYESLFESTARAYPPPEAKMN
jgi:ABC-type phosphate/phosphonate transport system substrate-binding protein